MRINKDIVPDAMIGLSQYLDEHPQNSLSFDQRLLRHSGVIVCARLINNIWGNPLITEFAYDHRIEVKHADRPDILPLLLPKGSIKVSFRPLGQPKDPERPAQTKSFNVGQNSIIYARQGIFLAHEVGYLVNRLDDDPHGRDRALNSNFRRRPQVTAKPTPCTYKR